MNIQRCINELLIDGTDDWVSLLDVAGTVKLYGGAATPEEVRDRGLQVLRAILEQGLMVIGDVREEYHGFRKWEVPIEEALIKVEHAWRNLTREAEWGFVCWLSSTEKGLELGELRLCEQAKNFQRCRDELLIHGADGIHLSKVADVARTFGGADSQEEVREDSLRVIRLLIEQKLMVAGDVIRGEYGGFREWDLPAQEGLARIEREWRALKRRLDRGEICWLRNTQTPIPQSPSAIFSNFQDVT